MRCAVFSKSPKQTPVSSNKSLTMSPSSMIIKTESVKDRPPHTRSSSASSLTLRAKRPRPEQPVSRFLPIPIVKSKLISPTCAASVEKTPSLTSPSEQKTTSKTQPTKERDVQANTSAQLQSVDVEMDISEDVKPFAKVLAGSGRHPHPPTGNNKKLKHKCPFDGCPWRFATPYKLRRHIKSHTKETPYLCKECGRGFSVRYNLLMHIQTIHSQPQRYKCPVRGCKEAFHSQPRLNGHMRRIHKKDIKAIYLPVKDSSASGCNSRGSSTSSIDSIGPSTTNQIPKAESGRQRRKYECSECKKEFPSQVKLNSHSRSHSGGKTFKCTTRECEKSFTSKERLLKHSEAHKSADQHSCPNENCNRVFLHQSHLKNHLKIHSQDHQFVCPVLDCNKNFNSESEYNSHLNTHINYGHKCSHPGCDLSFLSKKRLQFHCRAVHNTGSGDNPPSIFFDGIQPHLGIPHRSTYQNSSCHQATPFSFDHLSYPPTIKLEETSCGYHGDLITDVNLPGVTQKDIDSVISQNRNWSGEQIDQFLRSAVDLSEIESNIVSSLGYESDSGYSTYDVSPIMTTAPSQLGYSPHCHQINLQSTASVAGPDYSPGPMLNCTVSPTNTVFSNGPRSLSSSPCSSEVGFFSPRSRMDTLSTSSQEPCSFLPPPNPSSAFPQEICCGTYFLEETNTTDSIPSFSSQIPDIVVSSTDSTFVEVNRCHSYRRNSDSQLILRGNLNKDSSFNLTGHLGTRSVPNMGMMMQQYGDFGQNSGSPILSEPTSCRTMGIGLNMKQEDERRHLCNTELYRRPCESLCSSISQNACSQAPFQFHNFQSGSVSSRSESEKIAPNSRASATKKPKSSPATKSNSRRKNQWPRSMNKANMMAFRQHILNKLKKGQESVVEPCLAGYGNCIKQEAFSPKPAYTDLEYGSEVSEEKNNLNGYEFQVTIQRNVSMTNRSQSEPTINCSNPVVPDFLHPRQSTADVNGGTSMSTESKDRQFPDIFIGDADCEDILSSLQFNPDSLLSGVDEIHMLKTLGFDDADNSEEITKLLGVGSESLVGLSGAYSSEMMELGCIQDLLDDKQVSSPLSLPSLSETSSPLSPSPSLLSSSLLQGQSVPSPAFSGVCESNCMPNSTYNSTMPLSTPQYPAPVDGVVSTYVRVNDDSVNHAPLIGQETHVLVRGDVDMGAVHSLSPSTPDLMLAGNTGPFQLCTTEIFDM